MKAAECHLLIFEGVSAGRYPRRSRPSEQRHKRSTNGFSPAGCGDNRPGAVLASRLQPTAGMRPRSRLARGPFLPQRPPCDLISASLEDLGSAREFYERQADGVGDYFFDALFSEIDSLTLYAGIHTIRLGYHRLVVQRFPFCIYYRVSGDEVIVFRVLDARRDPDWIRRSLREGQ